MPERPDLRAIAENIREALSDYDREALLEMLTYVFKEYVVESPPPVLISQVDGIDGLADMSFAQLIETLQNRLDHPELAQFRISDDQVLVRVGGVLTPIDGAGSAARPPMPIGAPQTAPAPASVSAGPTGADRAAADRATAAEAERRGRGDLTGGRRGVNQAPPPRPRGVSVSSRPTSGPAAASNSAPNNPRPEPATPPEPSAAADPEPKPAEGDDDAAVRFSLLELD